MIADLKAYAEYNESGLPWLELVPRHWSTRVLKRLCSRSALYGANIPASEYVSTGVRFLRTTDITDDGRLRHGGVFVVETAVRDYMLGDGDLLVSRSGTIGRSLRYRAEVHGPCAYAGYLVRFVPAPIASADYLFHFTKSQAFADFLRVSAVSSTIENVNGEKYANMTVTVPPLAEQAAIARFLDWANGCLERAIRAKRKVIALLNEQKQAIIHRAVTRGLDPSVPLKPSGIPWLGDIPQHWDVRRLSSVASFGSGKAHEQFFQPNGRFVCVTARFVSTGGKARKYCSKNFRPAARGDVLMVMSDLPNGRALGRSYLVTDDGEYAVNQRVCRLTAHSIEPRLLARFANRNQHLLRQDDGMNQTHLSNYDFKTMPVVMPPMTEQVAIADFLDRQSAMRDAVADRLQRECDLLVEYRAKLVTDVVTGKLDVREAAARLPDEAPPDSVEDVADLSDASEVAHEAIA